MSSDVVSTLEEAIAALQAILRERGVTDNGWLYEIDQDVLNHSFPDDPRSPLVQGGPDVLLHRTIEPQIRILRHAIEEYNPRDDAQGYIVEDGLALAAEILHA